VALDDLVRERVREWVPAALAKRIDLGCDEARVNALEVDGDPVLLAEMVNNLIDNAIRYTPAGGIINVHVCASAEVPGVGAVLLVEDSGPGIPEHERELVFERFYRVLGSDPEGRNLDGSGLGLAIVREIAHKHQARITGRYAVENMARTWGLKKDQAETMLSAWQANNILSYEIADAHTKAYGLKVLQFI
jgi:two-component system sensor histidine kinase TctE